MCTVLEDRHSLQFSISIRYSYVAYRVFFFFFVYLGNKRTKKETASNPILTEYLLTYGYLLLSKAGIANYRKQRVSMGF